MTNDASHRLRRLLTALPILAQRGELSHAELERLTGLGPRELLDDLRALTEREDAPGGFIESVGVSLEPDRVSVRTSHFHRPTRLTVPEVCALELGLAMLRASSPPDEWPPIERARARVRKLIAKLGALAADPAPVHGTPPAGSDSPELAVLRDAQTSRRLARVRYRAGASTEAATRTIAPLALVPWNGTWYVVAHARESDGIRFYRLDRIEHAEMLPDTFTPPPGFSVEAVLPGGRPFRAPGAPTMRVRYSARIARWIAEREGVSPAADGTLTLEHPVADREWAVRHVLQYGPDAEVLEPATLRREIAQRLRRMLA